MCSLPICILQLLWHRFKISLRTCRNIVFFSKISLNPQSRHTAWLLNQRRSSWIHHESESMENSAMFDDRAGRTRAMVWITRPVDHLQQVGSVQSIFSHSLHFVQRKWDFPYLFIFSGMLRAIILLPSKLVSLPTCLPGKKPVRHPPHHKLNISLWNATEPLWQCFIGLLELT